MNLWYYLITCLLVSRKLGDQWSVHPEVLEDIEGFTCIMYGKAREKSVNKVRSITLRQMIGEDETLTTRSKVDLSRHPPCRDKLVPHIQRVNHRLAIYKRAATPIFWCPKPYDPNQGWEKNEGGTLEPVWSCGPILPTSLIDLLEGTVEEMDAEENEEEDIDWEGLNDE